MKILDRYIILRNFLINFVILLVVFVLLFVLVDLVFNFDEFLKAGRGMGLMRGLVWVVWDYYSPMVPFLYVYFSGLLVVAAMGFTFAGLSRSGEMVAMVSSGISMYRIAAPVVVVGFLLNALALPD